MYKTQSQRARASPTYKKKSSVPKKEDESTNQDLALVKELQDLKKKETPDKVKSKFDFTFN